MIIKVGVEFSQVLQI